jgi:hypothetical protein
MGVVRRRLALLLTAVALQAPAIAGAEPPASIDPAGGAVAVSAEGSFQAFARDWMTRIHARGAQDRANPRLTPQARALVASYREVAPEFETELQPTGRPGSPYVGVLRYTESIVNCEDLRGTGCHVVSTQPVTEIFRLRDGRWVY